MKYRVTTPIKRDGKKFYPGNILELSSEQAGPLLDAEAIEAVHKPFQNLSNIQKEEANEQ